mmetsp:Transcript_25997/g.43840  ORF Transcript_25997/g.43840 Transcript_25997/m.43840 type:complete len:227 (+) Transcript_25997:22-702(+)
MSATPSWLKESDEESAVTKASGSPVAQSTAKAVVSDPAVQSATANALKEHLVGGSTEKPRDEKKSQDEEIYPEDVPEEVDVDPVELKSMEFYHRILRGSFMAISILMAAAACLKIESAGIATVFIALYVFAFSILICCFELSLSFVSRWIAMNFGFLYSFSGRIAFLTFVAVMCFSLGIFGKVVMALVFAALLFNIYVLIVCPKFEQWLRYKHYFAIRGESPGSRV